MTNFIPQHGSLKPIALEGCRALERITKSPCLVFVINHLAHSIDDFVYSAIYRNRKQVGSGKRISLVLFSYGGNVHDAYKIMRLLRRRFERIVAYVPYMAKSAATFMCLGADEIVLAEQGELGPLDSQHPSPSDPEKPISALESFKALDAIRRFAFETLDEAMRHFMARGGFTMMEAIPHVTKFVGTIIDPLFRNFDVHKLGDYGRSLEVSQEYGMRMLRAHTYKDRGAQDVAQILTQLIWLYPSHTQVLDLDECSRLRLKARAATPEEEEALQKVTDNIGETVYIGMVPKEEGDAKRKEKGGSRRKKGQGGKR